MFSNKLLVKGVQHIDHDNSNIYATKFKIHNKIIVYKI